MTYTPFNDYVFLQAFSGAVAGLVGQSTPLTTASGSYTDTIAIAAAWAQEVDTQWGVATNPDLFQYEEIASFSNDLFEAYNPQPSPRGSTPTTYAPSAKALMVLLADAESYLEASGIFPPPIPGGGDTQIEVAARNGINNSLDVEGASTAIISGPTQPFSVGGFLNATNLRTVVNTSSQPMTLLNENDTTPDSARITTQSEGPITPPMGTPNTVAFLYDFSTSRVVLQNIGRSYPIYLNVKDYGALGNGQTTAADGTMDIDSNIFSSESAASPEGPAFGPGDVGKTIVVPGAGPGGVSLRTSILTYLSAGGVTLNASSSTAVTTSRAYWYSDDTAAIQDAVNAAIDFGFAGVAFPPSSGAYVTTSTVTAPNALTFLGTGGKVAGGVSGGYSNAPMIWHDFLGDMFVIDGSGGGDSAIWGKGTSGGGCQDLRLVQVYGNTFDEVPAGVAIKILVTSALQSPSWMQLDRLNIEESYQSPWTWAMVFDGTAIAGSGGLPNCRVSSVSTHTGAGASGALKLICCSSTKITDCEFHDTEGNITITGTEAGRSVGIVITGGDCVNLNLDYASQVSLSGTQVSEVTTTTNTLGPNFIMPGQLVVPFGPDLSIGSGTVVVWPNPTGQVNPCLQSSVPYCLPAGEYFSCAHSKTGTSDLDVVDATNATPVVVQTSGAHGLSSNVQVKVAGVLGNLGANGAHFVTVVDATHLSLNGSVGTGAYTSGGVVTPTMCSLIGLQSFGGTDECAIAPNGDIPIRLGGATSTIGFFGTAPIAQPELTGAVQVSTAQASLVAKMVALGLVTDGTINDAVSAAGTSIDVSGGVRVVFKTDTTSLANLTGGTVGQIVTVVFEMLPATTSADRSGNPATFLRLAGSANFTATAIWATLQLVYGGNSGAWTQIAACANPG